MVGLQKFFSILLVVGVLSFFFMADVLATGIGCVDISGQTATLTPPDSAYILFDSVAGNPGMANEACISDQTSEIRLLADGYTPYGVDVYPMKNFAWNENAGWLKFNWAEGTAISGNLQAAADMTGVLYGYIWNDNIGWIQLDWWRTDPDLYPSGKGTGGAPAIDFSGSKPYPIVGYAWNDSLGWINLAGAKTEWRPPIGIKIDKTSFVLDIPEKPVCENLYSVPYLKAEVDFVKPLPTPLSIKLISRPANIEPAKYKYSSSDAGAKVDGMPLPYSKDKSPAAYVWQSLLSELISINLNPTPNPGDPVCAAKIQLVPPFKYTCNGAPISYLPECEISKPGAAIYCQNDCLFKPKPTPTPTPSPLPDPLPTPIPPIEFCGNRKVETGENCDQGFYGGYLNAKQYCTSSCTLAEKPEIIPQQSPFPYPFSPKTAFAALENIMPANPLTHSFDTCFCLLDKDGKCLQVNNPISDIKVTVELENTMIFDQGLENTRNVKCEGKITDVDCGGKLTVDKMDIYKDRYNNTPTKTHYGEAAVIELYAKTDPTKKVFAMPVDDTDIGIYSAEVKLVSRGSTPIEDDAKVCLRVKSYMPTSGANAYDENHNGVIDPGDHFYDDGETDLYRIRAKKITYSLGRVNQEVSYVFEDEDGYFHFRAPLELTKLDTVDGKDFILAIADQVSRFLAYVTRVVPDNRSLTHLPSVGAVEVKIGVDRLDIGNIFWMDVDTLENKLQVIDTVAQALVGRQTSYESPQKKPLVYDDYVSIVADKLMGLDEKATDVECNLGLYCNLYLRPFYQTDSAKAQKIDEGKDVQIFSEISFTAANIKVPDELGKEINKPTQAMRYLSNQFPRGKESAIGNPLADIRGTISSSTGVYTRREGQVVITVGNLSTNTVRNAISANVSDIVRGSKLQKAVRKNAPVSVDSNKNAYIVGGPKDYFEQLLNKKVIYTKEDVIVKNLSTTKTADVANEQNTTIIVDGGNVFIDGNIEVEAARVGIIALKKCIKSVCTGGNVYIAPDVTDIYANIYADGSLFSYDGETTNIDSKTGVPKISDGQRVGLFAGTQLLIRGSLSSQNTVGGSVGEKGLYVLGDGTPTSKQSEAIPFDLNHLRYQQLVKKGGVYEAEITNRAVGLGSAESNKNEAIYVIYQAPPNGLPGFQVGGAAMTGEQVNR